MVSAGDVLAELVERAGERRRKKCSRKLHSLQLELFPDPLVPRDPERPLVDLLPEAYDV
jgi:hypothetical protein